MYAIVDIAGQQMKVEKDQKIFVHLLEGDTGVPVHFNRVLLIDNDKDILIGNPLLSDALITGKILSHVKGDKIKVFKKKRRKGYKVLKGHRQLFTEVQIEEILEKGGGKILKDIETRSETKKSVKTEKTEKPAKAAKPVTEKIKTSLEKEPEVVPETKIVAKKPAKLSEKKPKQSPVKVTAESKSSAPGKSPESKAKKAGSDASVKTEPGKTVKSGTTKTVATKKTGTTKKTEATKKTGRSESKKS